MFLSLSDAWHPCTRGKTHLCLHALQISSPYPLQGTSGDTSSTCMVQASSSWLPCLRQSSCPIPHEQASEKPNGELRDPAHMVRNAHSEGTTTCNLCCVSSSALRPIPRTVSCYENVLPKGNRCPQPPLHCRSFYYAGAFDGALGLFFSQLVNGQQPDGGLFDRFLIQCMLFHHAVLTCPSYKGTSGSFELSSAARSQVSATEPF